MAQLKARSQLEEFGCESGLSQRWPSGAKGQGLGMWGDWEPTCSPILRSFVKEGKTISYKEKRG